jgi:hypothetical protein
VPLYASNEEYSLKEVTPNHKEFKHSIVTLCFKPVPFYASSHIVVVVLVVVVGGGGSGS